jgi:superoxide dismutase, Fe-Mn family
MKHQLPKLSYSYQALEPYIDARTMEIHYSKHHQAYIDKLNAALEKYPELQEKSIEELLKDFNFVPEEIKSAVRNYGGGHFNHSFFWSSMEIGAGREPADDLAGAIKNAFGDFNRFKEKFSAAAAGVFGSGWAWLVLNKMKELSIATTLNQDCPVSQGLTPLLVLDVWEHAYYLKYQNRRPEYIEAWWNVVNWKEAGKRFKTEKSA